MGITHNIKLQEIFRMEEPEFLSSVISKYLEHSPSGEVNADELKIIIEWSEKTRTSAMFLEQLIQGNIMPIVADGEIEFY